MADSNRRRLLLSSLIRTVLPLAIPMLILSLLIWRTVGAGITKEIDSGNLTRLSQYSDYIDDQFDSLEHLEAILSSSPTIRYRLRSILNDNGPVTYDEYLALDTISDFLQSSIQYSTITESIYVYFPNREGWFFSSHGGMTMLSSNRDTIWYDILSKLIENNQRDWSGFRSSSWLDDEEVFSIIRPISSTGDWDEGVLILNADPEAVSRLLSSLMTDEVGNLIILGENGEPLFSTFTDSGRNYEIASSVTEDSPVTVFDEAVIYSEKIDDSGWTILLVIPQNVAYRLNYTVDLLILSLTIIIIFISVFLAIRRTTDELEMLTMLQQELEGKHDKKGKRVYLGLSKELFSSYIKARKLNDERTELELTALSLQLTPHFLYNTLQVIRWKAMGLTGRENDASLMIGDLSSLLGYVLGDRNIFSKLEDEINATKAYIAIQERRFSGEFRTEWIISEEADGEIEIPKLILQPIVENAISHGLRGSSGGLLKIEIFIHLGRSLKVRIIDNGNGIEKKKLRSIRRALSKQQVNGSISIGLGNIQTRLSLLFSPSRQLSIASKEGKGTVVTFSIPLDHAEFRRF